MGLLSFTPFGLYCAQGDFYIDPVKSVPRAVITHAHTDHGRSGHKQYLATPITSSLLKARIRSSLSIEEVSYHKAITHNGVTISFYPAGHVPGSAQIRVEYKGEVWVVSGDYKRTNDCVSEPFELVKCHTFITECTFGNPTYIWPDQAHVFSELNEWWRTNAEQGKPSYLMVYSLGKAQRVLKHLNTEIGPIYIHPTVANINDALLPHALSFPGTILDSTIKQNLGNALIITPSKKSAYPISPNSSLAGASGWMIDPYMKKRLALHEGFILSDHADFNELVTTIKETGAEKIIAVHGFITSFCKYLKKLGYNALAEEDIHGKIINEQLNLF